MTAACSVLTSAAAACCCVDERAACALLGCCAAESGVARTEASNHAHTHTSSATNNHRTHTTAKHGDVGSCDLSIALALEFLLPNSAQRTQHTTVHSLAHDQHAHALRHTHTLAHIVSTHHIDNDLRWRDCSVLLLCVVLLFCLPPAVLRVCPPATQSTAAATRKGKERKGRKTELTERHRTGCMCVHAIQPR